MKPATLAQLKKELKLRSPAEIEALCLRLARFKAENKELLTYLLFEAEDETGYQEHIKENIDELFDAIPNKNWYYLKKSIRKILKEVKKCARYSNSKETEVVLLLHFCHKLKNLNPSIKKNTTLFNLYERQLVLINNRIDKLHNDLQLDYKNELQELHY